MNFESYIEGPRWAFGPALVRKLAIDYGLTVHYVQEEKRLLTKTIFFMLSGPDEKCQAAKRALLEAVNDWNRMRP